MATFEVVPYRAVVLAHPNADALEIVQIGAFQSIVQINTIRDGDCVLYIPEGAICPEWIINHLGLKGRLAGSKSDRVKAVKLRGVLSQGLILPCPDGVIVRHDTNETFDVDPASTTDYASVLGITKYEPTIPVHMSGEVDSGVNITLRYDIENIKKYPHKFTVTDTVVVTEKLHGTWACVGHVPNIGPIITSKGNSSAMRWFKINDVNANNLYVKTLYHTPDGDTGQSVYQRLVEHFGNTQVYALGEIFGQKVQDLHYGQSTPVFRLFDVYVGSPGNGYYLDFDELEAVASAINVSTVPVLYRGPYNPILIDHYTTGHSTIGGNHMREGVVIRTTGMVRAADGMPDRIQLKSISPHYLLRKGKVTEYS